MSPNDIFRPTSTSHCPCSRKPYSPYGVSVKRLKVLSSPSTPARKFDDVFSGIMRPLRERPVLASRESRSRRVKRQRKGLAAAW